MTALETYLCFGENAALDYRISKNIWCRSTNVLLTDTSVKKCELKHVFIGQSWRTIHLFFPWKFQEMSKIEIVCNDFRLHRTITSEMYKKFVDFYSKIKISMSMARGRQLWQVSIEHFVNTPVIVIQSLWRLYFLSSNS